LLSCLAASAAAARRQPTSLSTACKQRQQRVQQSVVW
jgi:hypothetical protein